MKLAYVPQSAEEIARDRAAFHLRLEGLSVEACAERLGCSVDEVWASLERMLCVPPKQPKR
jgi:DNA-directed RNA polymerase specialized sigma24 family protein